MPHPARFWDEPDSNQKDKISTPNGQDNGVEMPTTTTKPPNKTTAGREVEWGEEQTGLTNIVT